ncbi:hypothetical protein Cp1R7AA1_006 [Mesorhizobium phage Cp1R7A-A1]|nr:hypothetical protein Cp1R7AA1_006 [Mesorhizobium phage Cp1R7A-A1]
MSVPCNHIADYYQRVWEAHKCIAWNLLRLGYREWSNGCPGPCNNLFGEDP